MKTINKEIKKPCTKKIIWVSFRYEYVDFRDCPTIQITTFNEISDVLTAKTTFCWVG